MIVLAFAALGAKPQIYNNFLEAGKYASADKNYPLALYFLEEAESLIPGDSIVDRYIVSARLRDANKELGNYDRALKYGEDCIGILKSLGGDSTPELMTDYAAQAIIYARKKDISKAKSYPDSILRIVSNPDLNMAYQKQGVTLMGLIYGKVGDWPMAESAYELAEMYSRRYPQSDDTQQSLNLLGNARYQNDNYDSALSAYESQRHICERLYGRDSRQYQWANYCMANMLAYMGDTYNGAGMYADVIKWYADRMLSDMQSLPSSERDAYLSDMLEILQNAIPFGVAAGFNEDDFTDLAGDYLLLTKGLLLATEKSTATLIRENGSPEEIAKLSALNDMRLRLEDLVADPASDRKEALNLYAEIKKFDMELADACAGYGSNVEDLNIIYDDIREILKDDEVILDFADFKPKSLPRQYVCYEIRKNQKFSKVHYICNGEQLDSLLNLEKGILSNLYSGEAGEEMASLIGKRLKEIAGDARTVYYVPSGIFHKLAIEAIPDGEGRLADNYTFRRLSSARELVKNGNEEIKPSALLYGGLTYSEDVRPLPRSLQEVTDISAALKSKVPVTVFSGNEGSKTTILNQNLDSPGIMHFSTHGYYYTPDDSNLPSPLEGYNNAMVLTGLVMSDGSLESKRGLLSAAEIAGCYFKDTSIATLAACHSGQGEVTSEGIYGLQRAFKKAGVDTVVMNLWEASDVATKLFMKTFYQDLINGSRDRHKAFEAARSAVRRQYPSPFYWAGFVMID